MTKYERSKLKMFDATDSQLAANETIFATMPALLAAITSFRTRLAHLHTAEEVNRRVLTGMTLDKKELKTNLSEQFAEAGAKVSAFAFATGNNALRKNMDFSLSELKRKGEDDLAHTCHNMFELITEHTDQMTEYGITPATVTTLEMLLHRYDTQRPLYRNAVANRSAWIQIRSAEFKAISALLRCSIDKLVQAFKKSHPDFYAAYRINRVIKKPGTRKTKVGGLLTDNETNAPVHNVLAIATDLTTGLRYEAHTNVKGYYTLPLPESSVYSISFSHPLYESPEEHQAEIGLGESKKINRALKKVSSG